jgi:hypothetical protein
MDLGATGETGCPAFAADFPDLFPFRAIPVPTERPRM